MDESTVHELKIWKQYFDDVESGRKPFEVRKLDRLFGVGHVLHLREWGPIDGYSGRETKKIITYVMNGGKWGLLEGNCILGIAPITTRLAALDDVDDKDFHFEKNYSYSDMMRLAMAMAGWCSEIRLRDAIHGTDAHNYASKFIKDKFPRSALFETELAKFPDTDFNKKDSVDDGQEGEGQAEDYLKASVGKALNIDFSKEQWYIDWWMLLDPQPSFRCIIRAMEAYKAALPVGDGEGEKRLISMVERRMKKAGIIDILINSLPEKEYSQLIYNFFESLREIDEPIINGNS